MPQAVSPAQSLPPRTDTAPVRRANTFRLWNSPPRRQKQQGGAHRSVLCRREVLGIRVPQQWPRTSLGLPGALVMGMMAFSFLVLFSPPLLGFLVLGASIPCSAGGWNCFTAAVVPYPSTRARPEPTRLLLCLIFINRDIEHALKSFCLVNHLAQ